MGSIQKKHDPEKVCCLTETFDLGFVGFTCAHFPNVYNIDCVYHSVRQVGVKGNSATSDGY